MISSRRPGPDAPLVFLGRIEEIKGPHLAIEVARRSGFPLVIAGNVPAEHRAFFEAKIEPHLDGSQVTVCRARSMIRRRIELLGQRAGPSDADPVGGALWHRHGRGDGLRHASDRARSRRSA